MPADHLDLLDAPLVAALATHLPSGSAQTQPLWCVREGSDILVNTTLQRRKGRNLLADPRATVLITDPVHSSGVIEVRADVELSTRDAGQHLDALTRTYTSHTRYYGEIYPFDQRNLQTRVIARLSPRRSRRRHPPLGPAPPAELVIRGKRTPPPGEAGPH